MWGPTFPELVEALPGIQIIDRSRSMPGMIPGGRSDRWDRPTRADHRRASLLRSVPLSRPLGRSARAMTPMSPSMLGNIRDTKREAGLLRIQQAA